MLIQGVVVSVDQPRIAGKSKVQVFRVLDLTCVNSPLVGCQVWLNDGDLPLQVAQTDVVRASVVGFVPNKYQPGGVSFTVRSVEIVSKGAGAAAFGLDGASNGVPVKK